MSEPKLGTILNVNDHEQTRYMVTRMLRMSGFEVLEAATGEDALRLAGTDPDLIVLDVKLPDISGFEVCRMIKSKPRTSSIIVLQTSATYVTAEKKVQGLDSGADSYLTHPFEPPELIATIKSLLRLRHAEQELRRRAEEMAEAARRKDVFLAMLAHELRNPLAAITTALPLLDTYRSDDERFGHVRGIMERQSRHLSRLVDDLLDVSRITHGKIELRKTLLDVALPLREAVQVSRSVYESRQQRLVLDLAPQPLYIHADMTRLEQVFSNLLDNASKYSERGSTVALLLRREIEDGKSYAVVEVRDQGIGIAPEFVPRLFDLFAQADESLERTRGGMGIGLTLVKRLVELHSGIVLAKSEGLGLGSSFIVRLPLVEGATAELAEATPRSLGASIQGAGITRRILLVEDNADAREMLQAVLELAGHTITVAPDGVRGVELAATWGPEVALVDIGLPNLNGYQVAERIRAMPIGRDLHLIALTGYGGDEQRLRILEAGFDIHLVKPVSPDMLLRILAALPPTRARVSHF